MKTSSVSVRRRMLLPLASLGMALAGCPTSTNLSPTATLTSPVEGGTVYPGPQLVYGQVSDPETEATSLTVSFVLGEQTCTTRAESDGQASCELEFVDEGEATLELWVIDAEGAKASDSVTVVVYDQPPSVSFESPLDGAPGYNQKSVINLIGKTVDPDEVPESCTFSSDLSGTLGSTTVDATSGLCSLPVTGLAAGTHKLTVVVTDSFGKTGSDWIYLPVLGCTDADLDGYSKECDADCNDTDPNVHPNAVELCDSRDNNCDGLSDNADDADGDSFSECSGDCDDANALVNPLAREVCDGIDNNCLLGVDEGFDRDKDGVSSCAVPVDCDDEDPLINPNAEEVCDDVDNDCDTEIDEDVTLTFYLDGDGDGFGAASAMVEACSAPPGSVEDSRDCDDQQAQIFPGADEVCNGKDDNCNGSTDEGTVPLTFYPDGDGDGYGNSLGTTQQGCILPVGYAVVGGDCDDVVDLVNPGLSEVCDGLDNNCSGVVDEGVQLTLYRDTDNDGVGVTSDSITACNDISGYAQLSGDCNDTDTNVYPFAPEQCNSKDDDCDSEIDESVATSTYYLDSDKDGYGTGATTKVSCAAPDGYVSRGGDCDDASSQVNPGVSESCNGKDDNCDGQFDEGVQTKFYQDSDKDGYGSATVFVFACAVPAGYVANSTDCADTSAATYPGAAEQCDGLDNNCNQALDEGLTQKVFYQDSDKDTWGNPAVTIMACAAPPGYTQYPWDCNDTTNIIYPGAREVCDSLDNDCDQIVDETTECYDDDKDGYTEKQGDCNDSDANIAPGKSEGTSPDGVDNNCDKYIDEGTICWDDDIDGYIEMSSVTQCPGYALGAYGSNPPKGGDCDDRRKTTYPGADEAFNGRDDNCDGSVDGVVKLTASPVVYKGDMANAQAGFSVAGVGDINGDGFGDLGVGAPTRDAQSKNRGAAFIIFGRSTGWASASLVTAGITLEEDKEESKGGFAVARAGDLDNDGVDDLAVSSPYRSSTTATSGGTAYLMYGKLSGWSSGKLSSLADASADGLSTSTLMGYSLAGGMDIDGNGVDDLTVGTPWPASLTSTGYMLVLVGRSTRYSRSIMPSDFAQVAGGNGDGLGTDLAMLGDVTGDGIADVAASGFGNISLPPPGKSEPGVVYVIPGSSKITPVQSYSLSTLGAKSWRGEANFEQIGYSVTGAGDMDGDGFGDVLIGRKEQTSPGQALAYLILGGTLPADGNIAGLADANFTGDTASCPCTVAGLGDLDGDGLGDFAVGVANSADNGTASGAVYLFYGSDETWGGSYALDTADVILLGTAGDMAGSSLSAAGDLNADGYDDLIIGAPGYDDGALANVGRAFVLFGFPRG